MKIEKGVPLPMVSKYSFHEMDINDSVVSISKEEGIKLRAAAQSYKNKNKDFCFTSRTVDNGCIRIWRIDAKTINP